MSDLRFAPDTLFLVAEEDWRLWKEDCLKGEKPSADMLPSEREGELAAPSEDQWPWNKQESDVEATSSSHDRKERHRSEAEANPEEGLRGWGRASKAKPAGFESASQELVDILHFCNTAHRENHGELI